MRILFFFFLGLVVNSGFSQSATTEKDASAAQPNILWLVVEDISSYLPMYGDSTIETPNLSRLAAEGICYDNVFAPAPVCAPARAAIATGMYPNRLGADHMRTGPWMMGEVTAQMKNIAAKNSPEGLVPYEAVPPAEVKMMSEYLRMAGYYCTNNVKEDYQFRKSLMAWDESSAKAHWRNREEGQPFFAVFNFEVTHESQIWQKAKDSLWVPEDLDVPVPPYLPDTELGKRDIRRLYSNIKEMDYQVGEVLKQLEDDGLLDQTIIFWYSDHGGPLPRQKRLLYDSGLKVPMIIRFPDKQNAGQRADELISFIDFAPTILSLAGIQPKAHFDGRAFLGDYADTQARDYIFACSDRFGPNTDNNRAARDKRFKYIRYYHPEKPMFQHTPYRDQMPIMQELYRLRDEGKLTEAQQQWFRSSKPQEVLFDTEADPHELHDLAGDPAYAEKLAELRNATLEWVKDVGDKNLQPEPELIREFWPNMEQPATATPTVKLNNQELSINCMTSGASIGYQILSSEEASNTWKVYDKPIAVDTGQVLLVIAHRIGYVPSETVRITVP